MTKIKAWYAKLPNAWKAGINTAWQSAVGTFLISLIGFLDQVKEWFTHSGAGDFPAVTPLGKAVAALVAGLIGGIVGVIYRGVKPGPIYPDVPPTPPDNQPDAGSIELVWVVRVASLVCFGWLWVATAGWFGLNSYVNFGAWLAAGLFFLVLSLFSLKIPKGPAALLVVVCMAASGGLAAPAKADALGMSGCQTDGIVWNGAAFGSQAHCSTSGGVVNQIRTWVSCNGGGPLYGPWVTAAGVRSSRFCPAGTSVTSYGYQTV